MTDAELAPGPSCACQRSVHQALGLQKLISWQGIITLSQKISAESLSLFLPTWALGRQDIRASGFLCANASTQA